MLRGLLVGSTIGLICVATPGEAQAVKQGEMVLFCGQSWADGNYQPYCYWTTSAVGDSSNAIGSGYGIEFTPSGLRDPCEQGNPIDISNGTKVQKELDFFSRGQVSLTLQREYRSNNSRDGLFGRYWESNFDYQLQVVGGLISVNMPGRGLFTFNPESGVANSWVPVGPGISAKVLKKADGTYELTWLNDSIQKYSSSGQPLSVKNPQNVGYDFSYVSGKLDRVTATSGRYVRFVWTGSQLTSVIDPAGGQYTYQYIANKFGTDRHLLQSITFPNSSREKVTYLYANSAYPGALTGKKLGLRQVAWYGFDSQGRANSTEHRNNGSPIEKYSFSYSTPDASTFIALETNPYGKQASYKFVNGSLESVTGFPSASCAASLFTVTKDALGYPDIETAFNGNKTDFDYDSAGRLVKEVRGLGSQSPTTITYSWDSTKNRPTGIVVVGDRSVSYQYDAIGRLASETIKNLSANGVANQERTTSYSYTAAANGLLITEKVDGPLAGTTDVQTITYSTAGDVVSIADALGTSLSFSGYNNLGLPAQSTDRYGVVTTYIYDAFGNKTQETRTSGTDVVTTKWRYDGSGRVSQEIAPDGRALTLDYDDAGRLAQESVGESTIDVEPPPGDTISQKSLTKYTYNSASDIVSTEIQRDVSIRHVDYDDSGRPHYTTTVETLGSVSRFKEYDELGHLKALRGNSGQFVQFSRDEDGNVIKRSEAPGIDNNFSYDDQNRVTGFVSPEGETSIFAYDIGGRVKTISDPRGHVTKFDYDGFGQLWRLENPDSGISTYTYDASGRRTGWTKADGTAIAWTYDALDRPVTQQSGSLLENITYDACTNGLGRICQFSDQSGSTSISYNLAGQVTRRAVVVDGASIGVTYEYDKFGRMTKLVYPDGKFATFQYSDGALRSVSLSSGAASQVLVDHLRYQPFGPLLAGRLGNGLLFESNHDEDGRMISAELVDPDTGSELQKRSYSYDTQNRLISQFDPAASPTTQVFSYDREGRLAAVGRSDNVDSTFSYDAVGNRITSSGTGLTNQVFQYSSSSNRLLQDSNRLWVTNSNGDVTGYTDANLNAVGVSYDPLGRISSTSRASLTTAYKYNMLGQRVFKSGPYGNVTYVYDNDGSLLSEYSAAGAWTNYIRVEGRLVAVSRGSQIYFAQVDHLGRPEILTDSQRSIVWKARNLPFDREVIVDQIGGLNIGYPGQYFDVETGLWYNYHRYYDPTIGRYLQSDRIALLGGINPYVYAGNDPIDLVDPLGLYCLTPEEIGALSGAIGGALAGAYMGKSNPYLSIGAGSLGAITGAGMGYLGETDSSTTGALFSAMNIAEGAPTPWGIIAKAWIGATVYLLPKQLTINDQSLDLEPGYNMLASAMGGGGSAFVDVLAMNPRSSQRLPIRGNVVRGIGVGLAIAAAQEAVKKALETNNDCGCN